MQDYAAKREKNYETMQRSTAVDGNSMGPKTSDNKGAQFQEEVDRLFDREGALDTEEDEKEENDDE